MIYTDEIGHLPCEALKAPYSDKKYLIKEIDNYLLNQQGLIEPKRKRFINVFQDMLTRKTMEVKKYRDY